MMKMKYVPTVLLILVTMTYCKVVMGEKDSVKFIPPRAPSALGNDEHVLTLPACQQEASDCESDYSYLYCLWQADECQLGCFRAFVNTNNANSLLYCKARCPDGCNDLPHNEKLNGVRNINP